MGTGVRKDFVEVSGRDSLSVDPMVKEDVEESPHNHLLSTTSDATVEWRPHGKPGGEVGAPTSGISRSVRPYK